MKVVCDSFLKKILHKMGIGNFLILAQTCCYVLSLLLSFVFFIPVAVCRHSFAGHCILYADAEFRRENEQKVDIHSWGASSNCGYVVFMGVVFMLVSIFMTCRMGMLLMKETEESFRSAFVNLLFTGLLLVMHLVACIVLTAGYNSWCDGLIASGDFHKCVDVSLGFHNYVTDEKINGSGFATQMGAAQFGAWMLFIDWFAILCFCAIKIVRLHQEENFFTSLNRERERIIQRGNTNVTI